MGLFDEVAQRIADLEARVLALEGTVVEPEPEPDQPPADALNVRDFGAVGDGSGNDSSAFVDALNAAGNGGTVVVPNGTYKIGTTISSSYLSGRTIWGESKAGVILVSATDDGSWDYPIIFNLTSRSNVTFQSLTMTGTRADANTSAACVVMGTATNITFRDVHWDKCYYAIKQDNRGEGTTDGFYVYDCSTGDDSQNPFYISDATNIVFEGCNFHQALYETNGAPPHVFYVESAVSNMLVEDTYLYGGTWQTIQLASDNTNYLSDITFRNIELRHATCGMVIHNPGGSTDNILFDGFYARTDGETWLSSYPWFRVQGPGSEKITFQNFDLDGLGVAYLSNNTGPVTFKDGTLTNMSMYSPTGFSISGTAPTITNVSVS